jgi:anti-sigma factor RsiW
MEGMQADRHIGDEELLLALDGELGEPRQSAVEEHVRHCWECRRRCVQMEAGITDYMDVHAPLAPGAAVGATARLRARLREESRCAIDADRGEVGFWAGFGRALGRGWARVPGRLVAGGLAALLLPVAVVLVWMSGRTLEASGPLPDARLTPGAVRLLSRQQVCVVVMEDEGRTVPAELARRVFAQYRIENPKPRAYEVDYLISPALGGTTALENLWPVPYAEGVWTSRVKDALEDYLRSQVCEGKLDLATAQQELATNWIAAYQKHFRTKVPVAAHALFVKDSPWE